MFLLKLPPCNCRVWKPVWWRLSEQGRLYGAVMDGFWMHVGDPAAREATEAKLR